MINKSTFLKKNSYKSSSLFQPKIWQFQRPLFAILLFVFIGLSANAQTNRYWSGGSGTSDNIDQGANWFGGSNPNSGDNLYFNNTYGSRHWVYSNYASGSWFNYFITYNGAGGIKLYGDNTYALKFENNSDGSLLELSPSSAGAGSREIGNRIGNDLEINPVGTGGILVSCDKIAMDNATTARNLKVYGGNTLTVNGIIYEKNGTGATLQLLGTATVELKGTSTFTGLTTITGGTLKLNATGGALKSGNDVTIAGGTLRVMQSQTLHNLTISSGMLQVDAGVTLTITGTTTNAGTITNLGTITNSGLINNTGTITNTSGIIKNTSNVSGTGYLLSTSSIENVIQEYYLSSNQRGWRLLSNPLSSTTFGILASGSTTPFTLGANASGTYNSVGNTWTNYTDGSTMVSQEAYKVFIRGIVGEGVGGVYTGTPSNVTISVTGTAANTVPTTITTVSGQYYLVANPYTAPISVSSILAASSGLSGSVSYYNPTKSSTDVKLKAGGYDVVIVSGVAGSTTDVVLPPMGAIFVLASSAGTISIPKSAIYTGTVTSPAGNFAHKIANTQNVAPVALTVNVTSNGVDYDKLQLRFKEAGTVGSNIDFGKMPNTILDFYSINGVNTMAVSELELVEQTIPLGINSTALQSFRFTIAENSIPAGFEAVLEDKLLNTKTVLTTGTNYDFSIDASPASQGTARFDITLKTMMPLSVQDQELDEKIIIWPNPAYNQFNIKNNKLEGDTTFKIYSITGQLIHSEKAVSGTTTTLNTNGWARGVYILNVSQNGNKTTRQLIIQ